jgi:hypothetical protein
MAALVVAALTVSASAFAQSSLPLPSPDDVVLAGGSETLGTLPMGNLPLPAECPACITVDFNDLTPEQVVSPDRYKTLGLRIEIGPSGTTGEGFIGSVTGTPCDGTRSLKPTPFGGPSFLLRFPHGVTSVSLDAGDIGSSDSDVISVKAFSDDALTTLIDVDAAPLPQGAPTGCVRLSVQTDITQTPIIKIKAVETTSDSVYVLSSNSPSGVASYPNSIFVDNVTFSY